MLDKSLGWAATVRCVARLRRRRFDALLHMHASTRANLVSLVVSLAAPDRLRSGARSRLINGSSATSTEPKPQRHVMDGLFEFAELIGVPLPREADLEHPG